GGQMLRILIRWLASLSIVGAAGFAIVQSAGASPSATTSIHRDLRVTVAARSWPHLPSIQFSHAVVVDEQRPGFEPDVKVDGNGTIYTSVPFGFSTTQSF